MDSNGKINISESEFNYASDVIKKLSNYFDAKVVGQQQLLILLLA